MKQPLPTPGGTNGTQFSGNYTNARRSSAKVADPMRDRLRYRHYSLRTEESDVHWIKRFILFHHTHHPRDMGADEIEAYLSHLAVDRNVSASTPN